MNTKKSETEKRNSNRQQHCKWLKAWPERWGVPHPALRSQGFTAKNTKTEAFRSIWVAKPQETERDSPGSPAPRVPPIRVLGAGDQNPFPLTLTVEVYKHSAKQPPFPLKEILVMWYPDISWTEPREQRKQTLTCLHVAMSTCESTGNPSVPTSPLRNQSIRQKLSRISSSEYSRTPETQTSSEPELPQPSCREMVG